MRQQPGLDGQPIIRVAVRRYYWLPHELPRYRTGKFISEHLMGAQWYDDRALRLGRARFRFWWCAAVVGVARRVGHVFRTVCAAAVASAVFLPVGPYFEL